MNHYDPKNLLLMQQVFCFSTAALGYGQIV
jgi:hypothetical protein